MRIILLGPQRRATVDGVARALAPDGPVATVTAGWQEREPDDGFHHRPPLRSQQDDPHDA